MQNAISLRFALVAGLFFAPALGVAKGPVDRDLWVHPREDGYDPQRHYKAQDGELYYHAENDIQAGLGDIVVIGGAEPRVEATLGADLKAYVETHGGGLRPVMHWDSNGDGKVDRTLRGRLANDRAIFEMPALKEIDFQRDLWQLGIVYQAGDAGLRETDGRYLASVDSKSAHVEYPQGLAEVGAGPPAGLVILKHREGAPFDFASFIANPTPFLGDFDELSRAKDADDWTTRGQKGKLRTHFQQEDLFIVHTAGNVRLAVEWGDVPVSQFLEDDLNVRMGADGCYSTLDAGVVSEDGQQREVPQTLYYCPDKSLFVFEAPDGYQIFLSALHGQEQLERTEASMSIRDNIRLYAWQVFKRSPRKRATGQVGANIVAGFYDAGDDVMDAGKRLTVGTQRTNVHTGQTHYRTSPLLMLPRAAQRLAEVKPVAALGELLTGTQETVYAVADTVSAVNNAVINPVIQGTVGYAASPAAADTTDHWFGAVTQSWAQNLPMSERTLDAFSPLSLWNHNRGHAPSGYTRTDTQLNIDRIVSLANIFGLRAIILSATSGSNGGSPPPAADGPGPGPGPGSGPSMSPCPGRMMMMPGAD